MNNSDAFCGYDLYVNAETILAEPQEEPGFARTLYASCPTCVASEE
ncbi:hypothetical protein ACFVJ4_36360 [Streptomyces sp. NPDC127178]